jgi:hypothetical protein
MIVRSVSLVAVLMLIIVLGCSTGGPKPGTTGTTSAKKIELTTHPVVPEGVNCYVCHKEDIPAFAAHKKFGNTCSDCHVTSTWMAAKYPHPGWALTGAHNVRCNFCHAKMAQFDFTYQCWGCHHDQAATIKTHADRGIKDISNCIACHKEVKI